MAIQEDSMSLASKPMTGPAYIVAAIFLWSSLGLVVRASGVQVHVLIFYSCAVSVAIMSVLLIARGFSFRSVVGSGGFYPLLLLGPLALSNTFSFFVAYKNTTIAKAIITHYIAPVIVAFAAPFFLKERLSWRVAVSVALASIGLWMLLGVNPVEFIVSFEGRDSEQTGILFGLLSGVTYAAIIMVFRVYSKRYRDPVMLSMFTNLAICLILLPFIREFPSNAVWSFLLMGAVHSTLAPVLYYKGLESVEANRVAVIGYLEPVCAIILGMIFLKEFPGAASLSGGALILFSGYLTLKKADGANKNPSEGIEK